ncbi:MAG: radical SAM protein [Thermoplasmata archaeon]|nr:MAG: radical SAM protein [Thermoplasmata archaeon]
MNFQITEICGFTSSFKTALELLEDGIEQEGYDVARKYASELNINDGDPRPIRDGSIITIFDKTPKPVNKNDVYCPHFVEFKWANGCNFNCSWCYLNGTLRFRPMGKAPYIKDPDKIKQHLREYFAQVTKPTLLNSGELSDSLVDDGNGFSLCKDIIPIFTTQNIHKLLILTKYGGPRRILRTESQGHVIVSFSVNSFKVAQRWEKRAPSPMKRIEAAKKLHEEGYEVRLRIDPIVPIENWDLEYQELVDFIFSNFKPERITLGSLRGLQSTINNSKDRSWTEYLEERSNWGLKIPFEKRFEIYSRIIKYLKKEYRYQIIGLCKETLEIWDKLEWEEQSALKAPKEEKFWKRPEPSGQNP